MRIAGKTWYLVMGCHIWQDYGGVWARPAGPDAPGLWFAVRYVPARTAQGEASCTIFEIMPAEVSTLALQGIGHTGRDLYGDPLPLLTDALLRIRAAVWCEEGRVDQIYASTTGNGCAARLRATAARYAVGYRSN